MANSIVSKLTADELIALFRKEAKIGNDGSVEFSRKGIARLTGKSKPTIQLLLGKVKGGIKLSNSLQPFANQQFLEQEPISFPVVIGILFHYSKKGDQRATSLFFQLPFLGFAEQVNQYLQLIKTVDAEKPLLKSVYVIGCRKVGVIKIGISEKPEKRLKGIQTGYPFQLEILRVVKSSDAKQIEQDLHRALADFKLKGEWFDGAALDRFDILVKTKGFAGQYQQGLILK